MSCLSVSNLLEDCFCCLVLALLEIAVGLGSRRKGIKQSATDHYFAKILLQNLNQNFYPKMQDKIRNRKSGLRARKVLYQVVQGLGHVGVV